METTEKHLTFAAAMAENGFQYRILPVNRVEELFERMAHTLQEEITDIEFARFIGSMHSKQVLEKFPQMRSVIVVSKYDPACKVSFHYRGEEIKVLIPPGNVKFYPKQRELQQIILSTLATLGFDARRIILPVKLLAVCSGLAKYGRNNITYVPGWGSYHFLASFVTDLPPDADYWQEMEMLPACQSCSICLANCPTGAITNDRFLIHGEKCLTHFNENTGSFPNWIQEEWHNSLIGCIRCQDVCPANSEVSDRAETLPGFDEAETEILLSSDDFNRLPLNLQARFEQFGFPEFHGIILRNLKALFR